MRWLVLGIAVLINSFSVGTSAELPELVRLSVKSAQACKALPVLHQFLCAQCMEKPDVAQFVMSIRHGNVESSYCERWYQPFPEERKMVCAGGIVDLQCFKSGLESLDTNKSTVNTRCDLLDLPPGSVCVNGVPLKLADALYDTPVKAVGDLCSLVDFGAGSGCSDNLLTELLPRRSAKVIIYDPCQQMDLPTDSPCAGGLILPLNPIDETAGIEPDRCAYMETATGTKCSNGIIEAMEQTPPKVTSEAGDDWKERDEFILERNKILAALANGNRQRGLIRWRELGAYLKVVGSFEFTRVLQMREISDPVSAWKGGKELFGGAFSISERLDAVRRQFEIERTENSRSTNLLLVRKQAVDEAIYANETRRTEANKASDDRDDHDRRGREEKERQHREDERRKARDERENQRRADSEKRELQRQAAESRRLNEKLNRETETNKPDNPPAPKRETPLKRQDTPVKQSPEAPIKLDKKG